MIGSVPTFAQPPPPALPPPPPPPPTLPAPLTPPPLWRQKFPTIISSLLSFLQCVITIVIIGCEVGSMLIDIVTGTIYVGLWASLFFMSAWISLSGAACCCRGRGCATYTLAIQLISMFFALCVIGFDIFYIVSPTTCFFPSSICSSTASTRGVLYSEANFNNVKIPLIKGQLAAGIVMFLLCALYVVIYLVTTFRFHRAKQPKAIQPQVQNPLIPPSTGSNSVWPMPPMASYPHPSIIGYPMSMLGYSPSMMLPHGDARMTELPCPSCKSVLNMTATKRAPI